MNPAGCQDLGVSCCSLGFSCSLVVMKGWFRGGSGMFGRCQWAQRALAGSVQVGSDSASSEVDEGMGSSW